MAHGRRGKSVGQRIGQSIGQRIGQSIGQRIGQCMGQRIGQRMASGDLPAQVEGVVKEAELRGHCEQVDRALGQAGVHEGGAHDLEGPG